MRRLPFLVLALACGSSSSPAPPLPTDTGTALEVAEDAPPSQPDAGPTDAPPPPPTSADSVLQHHKSATRDGHFVAPAFTRAAAAGLTLDPTFAPAIDGPVYAQVLYVEGSPDLVIAVTERDEAWAYDASTGAVVWKTKVGDPVPLSSLPCGNIDPLGITSTPVADPESRTLYLDAMTTPDGGQSKRHRIFALSLDDGQVRAGWPVDVSAAIAGFDSEVQNQRGALLLANGVVYVPFGGHWGDCGEYNGWVVGVPQDDPAHPVAWKTRAKGGATWAPSGLATDGTGVFVTTGNTFGADTWSDGEAVIRLDFGPTFSQQAKDWWAPTDWKQLDAQDLDIGGSGPVLFEVDGAKRTIALGKNGWAYLLDRTNLGGVSSGLASARVTKTEIIGAAAAYRTAKGSYVVFKGEGEGCPNSAGAGLVALKVSASAMSIAWCATVNGLGSPAVTTTDGTADPIVWMVGSEGDNKLHGFDGDTGGTVYTQPDAMGTLRRYIPPIIAKGRLFVAGNQAVYAFKP